MIDSTEVLAIGGGPAGAAAGVLLARRGREVTIVEKSTATHDKVCGEFLSTEGVQYLTQLGLDLPGLGAVRVSGVRLARRKQITEYHLPFDAMALSRKALDEALLALAAREGATVQRGERIVALRRSQTSWSAQMNNGGQLHARSVFLATGKHDLNGWRRSPGIQNDLVAFKMYFGVAHAQQQALRGWIELCLFPGGYAGLQLTEDGNANLCLLVTHDMLRQCGNHLPTLLMRILNFSEHLAERLEGAVPLLTKPLALSSIPYGYLVRDADPDLWRLGDQAAVTPSFSGDGMSIALHSAALAADLYMKGGNPRELTAKLKSDLRGSIALATAVSRLMISAPGLAKLLRAYPSALQLLAERTRIPQTALMS
jgi:flavin-dependent dehydrogenase